MILIQSFRGSYMDVIATTQHLTKYGPNDNVGPKEIMVGTKSGQQFVEPVVNTRTLFI